MISIGYNSDVDKYADYGMEHFVQTYGIPGKLNRNRLLYPNEDSSFHIEIEKMEEDEILEWLGKNSNVDLEKFVKYYADEIYLGFDVFKMVGLSLTGKLENLGLNGTKPLADAYERKLFELLKHACRETQIPLVHKTFWPKGKFAVCLTHDVDEIRKTYQYFTRFLKHLRGKEFENALYHLKSFFTDKIHGKNPYWTFEEIMELEEKVGVKSTFFFLKETAKVKILDPSTWSHHARKYDFWEVKSVIDKLSSGGWEVGLHGSYYSFEDERKLKEEKESLEKVLGKEVGGIRQHHLNLKFPDTWIFQERVGFDYDTSLGFKGGSRRVGFRWLTCFPFHPLAEGRTLSLLEIPLAIMDICINPKEDWQRCVAVLEEVEKHEGVLTLLWHHTVFNEKEYPSWKRFYAELIELAARKKAWITSGIEIAGWWKKREAANLDFEFNGKKLKVTSKVPVKIYLSDEIEIESNVVFERVRI